MKELRQQPEFRAALTAGYDAARGKQASSLKALKQDPEYVRRQREGAQRWQGQHERHCGQCGQLFTGGRFALVCATCRPRNRAWAKRMMLHLLARDGAACQLCGKPIDFDFNLDRNAPDGPSIDHRIPFSKGGKAEPGNFRLAHRLCNSQRGNRD